MLQLDRYGIILIKYKRIQSYLFDLNFYFQCLTQLLIKHYFYLQVAPVIKERMQRKGSLMIGYQPLSNKNFVNFFRIIIISSRLRDEHLEHVLDEIDSLGKDL